MAEFDPDAYLAAKPFDPDAYLADGEPAAPPKRMGALRAAATGVGDVLNLATGVFGVRPALSGAVGALMPGEGTMGERYKANKDASEQGIQESRRRLGQASDAVLGTSLPGDVMAGTAGIAGDTALTMGMGPAAKLLAPTSNLAGPAAHVLKRALAGGMDAMGLSSIIGAIRGTGTEKGPLAGATEGLESPWNALGVAGPVLSAVVGGRRMTDTGLTKGGSLNRARETAGRLLRLDPAKTELAYGEPSPTGQPVHTEESFRRAGQRAIDLGAAEPGLEPGQRVQAVARSTAAATQELENTIQELNVRGATLDRSALLTDIKNAILARFDKPGAAGFSAEMRTVADEVLQKIANDRDLRSGAPLGNFVTAKRFLQATFEKHKTPAPGAFNDMLAKAERDAASVLREHTEAAAVKADADLGAKFKALNDQLHKEIPLREGAEWAAKQGLTGRDQSTPAYATTPKSFAERAVLGKIIHGSAPYRVKMNQKLHAAHQATPDNFQQLLVQQLRNSGEY